MKHIHRSLRYWGFGLATVFGLRRLGYFIPYRYAASGPDRASYPALNGLFADARVAFETVLAAIERFARELESLSGAPPQPRWTQGWFPRLDAAAAYALVRLYQPGRIVEVGSGHSTRFLARAVADGGLATTIVAIDPAPRADITKLPIDAVKADVRTLGTAPFDALRPGDILFIDSSHIAMPGTDVDYLITTILPRLDVGVLVHVHDIFLPDDYPTHWRWRGYNEQSLIAALLACGGWRPLFASNFVATHMKEHWSSGVIGRLPLWPGVPETSLWMVRGQEALKKAG